MKIKNFLILLICFLFLGCHEGVKTQGEIGKVAPDISAFRLNGDSVKLSDFKNKIKILIFWQDGCAGCLKSLPNLDKMLDKYGNEMVVLAINSVNKENKIRDYIKKSNYKHLQILEDKLDISWTRYSIFALPSIIVIGKDNIVKDRIIGDRPWETTKSKLLRFL